MTTKFLQTEQEYLAALKEVSPLFDLDSAEDDRFLELCTAIQDYEKRHFPEFNVNIIKYTICIHQAENGDHSGFVPDITGCYFAGNSLDAAIADAYAAIDIHLVYQAEKGKAIPMAKDISEYINDDDCRNGYLTCIDIDITKYTANAI